MNEVKTTRIIAITILMFGSCQLAVRADDGCDVDFSKLNLSQDQSVRIQQCDQEWFQEYQQTQPEIQSLQQKLKHLLSSNKPDATEIMLVQQQIESRKAKLKMKATQVTLRKKEILDENQKNAFNSQIQSAIVRRGQQARGIETSVQPVRWKKMWNQVQNVFNQEK